MSEEFARVYLNGEEVAVGYLVGPLPWETPPNVTLLVTGVPLGATSHFLCEHWHALFCAQSSRGQVMIVRGPAGSPCDPRQRPVPGNVSEAFTEAELLHEISFLISEGMASGDH